MQHLVFEFDFVRQALKPPTTAAAAPVYFRKRLRSETLQKRRDYTQSGTIKLVIWLVHEKPPVTMRSRGIVARLTSYVQTTRTAASRPSHPYRSARTAATAPEGIAASMKRISVGREQMDATESHSCGVKNAKRVAVKRYLCHSKLSCDCLLWATKSGQC